MYFQWGCIMCMHPPKYIRFNSMFDFWYFKTDLAVKYRIHRLQLPEEMYMTKMYTCMVKYYVGVIY